MKGANKNLVRFLSALFLSSLLFILTVSAQTDETDSTVTGETNSTDVEAIALLFNTFPLLGVLSPGDPCLPTPFPWVECSSDDTPRITALNLGNYDSVVGVDLPDFSAMDALETIDLSNDFLVLDFPDFLADFPKLKVLNLANVLFTGTVPTSLWERSKNKTLKLTLTGLGTTLCYSDEAVCQVDTGSGTSPGTNGGTPTGNSGMTTTNFNPTPVKSRKNKTVPIVLGTGIPIFVIFWAIVGFLAVDHQKRKAAASAGQMNGISGPAMPTHGHTMSPNPLLHGMNFQDLASEAHNILPDDQGVNTDQQMHPTV
ncbi:hypothetical protein MKW98_003761 [Papaver atlanticum]|uniref:Uncharacterized protein n=1 Tax=Papaver atlanticum TaxID=357466 RepID=A0AAD4XQ26_9MAGN|nr:hypothetical protein MKW98_003761 [Papaver atlanticum]